LECEFHRRRDCVYSLDSFVKTALTVRFEFTPTSAVLLHLAFIK
jgi:hypothetical protein